MNTEMITIRYFQLLYKVGKRLRGIIVYPLAVLGSFIAILCEGFLCGWDLMMSQRQIEKQRGMERKVSSVLKGMRADGPELILTIDEALAYLRNQEKMRQGASIKYPRIHINQKSKEPSDAR